MKEIIKAISRELEFLKAKIITEAKCYDLNGDIKNMTICFNLIDWLNNKKNEFDNLFKQEEMREELIKKLEEREELEVLIKYFINLGGKIKNPALANWVGERRCELLDFAQTGAFPEEAQKCRTVRTLDDINQEEEIK
jgi:hypothetical protein